MIKRINGRLHPFGNEETSTHRDKNKEVPNLK